MTDQADLRVSDQERERLVSEIREHFAAGRLSEDELDERVQAAYNARTASELNDVRRDLPKLPPTPTERHAELTERRGHLQRRLLQQSGGAVVPFLICTVIWVASGATGAFWPIWLLLIAAIPLARNGWRLYGPAPELDRVEEDLTRLEQGEDRPGDRRRRRDERLGDRRRRRQLPRE